MKERASRKLFLGGAIGIAMALIPMSVFAATDYYVSASGSDLSAGTQVAPFKTITKAASVVAAGGTVHVAPGAYSGGFTTTANGTASARIRYVSDTKWGAKIVGSGAGYIWVNKGNYVTVDGFDLTGSGNAHGLLSGPWDTGDGDVGHQDRKSTRLNSSHIQKSRMPSSA